MQSNRWSKTILAGLVCFVAVASSRAGLTWEKDSLELTPEAGENVIRTDYAFTNNGTDSVSVVAIKPSCGCVATNLEKFDYAPGESGKIKVTFDAGMDKGEALEDRTIKVVTSDAPESPKVLRLRVHVPETVTASPEGLVWQHGKEPTPKEIVVRAGEGVKDIKLNQTAANENFLVEMKPEVEGQSYRLKITPRNTDTRSYAELDFNVASPSFKRQINCEIHVQVD